MSQSIKKIVKMMQSNDIEAKAAAAKVLGELRPKDSRTLKALCQELKYNNVGVRKNIIEAIGKISNPWAITEIIRFLNEPELLRTTIEAIVNIGPRTVKSLEKAYGHENMEFKKSVVEILMRLRDQHSIRLLFRIINESDSVLLEWVSEAITRHSVQFNQTEKRTFKRLLLKNVGKVIQASNELKIVVYIKLIGIVQTTEAFPYLIKLMDESMPPRVRRNAILSLMILPFKKNYEPKLIKLLMPLLHDKDYPNIVWNVLKIVQRYELASGYEPVMIKLLRHTPHRGVKKFAINFLAKQKSREAIGAVIDAMWEQDKELRSEALYGIKLSPISVDVVIDRMEKDIDDEHMDIYIDILKNNLGSLSRQHIEKMKNYLCRGCEHNQRFVANLFDLLRQMEGDKLCAYILERYQKVKKDVKLGIQESYMRLLFDSGFINDDIKLELAMILLKKHHKKIPEEEKIEEDEMFALVRALIGNTKFTIVKNVKNQMKFLGKEDYYYLGYYFSEKLGREKAFGGEILRFVISEYPKTMECRRAKEKMTLEKIPLKM